eukprot:3599230-Pleurochrysis_carterae.AAC.1
MCSSSTSRAHAGVSALQLFDAEQSARRVSTLVPSLDALLGGGVQPAVLTELSGVPGVGKTQLAMQLAVSAQTPAALGGVDGDAVYIDTEGSFMAERALQMAEGLSTELAQQVDATRRARGSTGAHDTAGVRGLCRAAACADSYDGEEAAPASPSAEQMLDGIHVFRTHAKEELMSVLRALPAFIAQLRRRVRLLVVDSIAFHLRHDGGKHDYAKRMQTLGRVAQTLTELAGRHSLAVVVVNQLTASLEASRLYTCTSRPHFGEPATFFALHGSQVTTRVNDKTGESWLVPALGDSWAHACRLQLLLQWQNGERVASLYKGGQPGRAAFQVLREGVRGTHTWDEVAQQQAQEQRQAEEQRHALQQAHVHLPEQAQPTAQQHAQQMAEPLARANGSAGSLLGLQQAQKQASAGDAARSARVHDAHTTALESRHQPASLARKRSLEAEESRFGLFDQGGRASELIQASPADNPSTPTPLVRRGHDHERYPRYEASSSPAVPSPGLVTMNWYDCPVASAPLGFNSTCEDSGFD